jgi:diacylglycerol kinase family enzyme
MLMHYVESGQWRRFKKALCGGCKASVNAASLGHSAAVLENCRNNRRKDDSVSFTVFCGGYKPSLTVAIFHIFLHF